MMTTEPELYRCFGCDRTTRDRNLLILNRADGRLRCSECLTYEREQDLPVETYAVEITISVKPKAEPRWIPFDPPMINPDGTEVRGIWFTEYEAAP